MLTRLKNGFADRRSPASLTAFRADEEGSIGMMFGLMVIPCIMLGSMTGATIAMLAHVGNHAPHGGPIVTFVVDNKGMYLVAIAVGTLVTALAITVLKRVWPAADETPEAA